MKEMVLLMDAKEAGKTIYIMGNGGSAATASLRSIEYKDPRLVVGDVNGDGYVDVADIAAIIDAMAGNDQSSASAADVNGDGVVDVADISAVIDIMAGN